MQFGYEKITDYFQWLVDINNLISKGSISIVSLLFIYCLGVNIAKIYKTDTLSSGLVALSSFIISISNSMTSTYNLSNNNNIDLTTLFTDVEGITVTGNSLNVTISGLLPGTQINSNGYFTAIIIGFIFNYFCKLMNKNWTIKLPDTVPPAIAKPFLSIIPALVSLYIIAILTFLLNRITGKILTDVIYEILQRPMLGLSQSFCCYISCFLSSIFLVFGIHGGNVMAPIMEGVFG